MIVVIMPFISFGMSLVATVSDSLLTTLVSEKEQVRSASPAHHRQCFLFVSGACTRGGDLVQLSGADLRTDDIGLHPGGVRLRHLRRHRLPVDSRRPCLHLSFPSPGELAEKVES